MTDGQSGGELSPWDRPPNDLLSLNDVLRAAALRPSRIEDEERAQIAVRLTPPGYRAIMGQLAHEHRVSYSFLTRHALDLGIGIFDAHPAIGALRHAYDLTRSDAMSSGDQDALVRLNQQVSYEFQRSQVDRTTLTVSRETAARLAELAMICGIPTGKLGVLTVLLAVLTLPNNRGYRDGLIAEVAAFHRFVVRRTRVLLLGDGADPGRPGGPRKLK